MARARPVFHIWVSSYGEVRLTDGFVAEADARWPDKRYTRVPKWAGMVYEAMEKLMGDCYLGVRPRIVTLKSLTAIEPYLRLSAHQDENKTAAARLPYKRLR